MSRNLFNLKPIRSYSLIDLDKKATLAIQSHFRLTNSQMLLLIWMKGLWTGILLSLVIHHSINH